MVILSAGWLQYGPFEQITNIEVQRHININVLHVIYCAKVLTSHLVAHHDSTGKKGALIILSSLQALFACAGCTTYSATKVFDHYLAQGLAVELAGKVDVMSYIPGLVDTPFIRDKQLKKDRQSMMV